VKLAIGLILLLALLGLAAVGAALVLTLGALAEGLFRFLKKLYGEAEEERPVLSGAVPTRGRH